jgi:hypothetical protein
MKKNILMATAISLLVLGSACKKDKNKPEVTNPTATAVKFTSAISGQIKTKAANDKWDANDAIGVYMKTGTGLSTVLASNKSYSTNGDGAFAASATDQTIYYPETGNVDFIAYYPYKSTLSGNTYAVDVTSQTNQAAIDLLYSSNATGLSKTSTTANLVFAHQLSKIEFTVKKGTGVADLNSLGVVLAGLNTKANFDLATGALSSATSTADISAKTTAQSANVLAEAIVVPTADAAGKVITFTLPAGQFKLTLPAGTQYEAGKKYTYDIELKNDQTTPTPTPVAIALSATITNWTNVPSGSYTVDQDKSGTTPSQGTETELYNENFGEDVSLVNGTTKPKVATYTGWKNKSLTFSDSYGNTDLRTISTYTGINHAWLPAAKDASLKIEGIQTTGYTKLKLKYDVASNVSGSSNSTNQNVITVKVNGVSVTVPSRAITGSEQNKFITVELTDISPATTGTTTIEFYAPAAANTYGMRLDNVIITGVK